MKKIYFFVFSFLFITGVHAQLQQQQVKHEHVDNELMMKNTEHDFGKIPQGKPVYYSFEVVNNGKEPLKIENITATCGCTTPEWSKEPIAVGASSLIKVGYNSAAEGYFEKFITIQYNGSHSKQLKIKGTVWKAPVGAAPANSSIQFLKQQIL